jgi:hypothetical protein
MHLLLYCGCPSGEDAAIRRLGGEVDRKEKIGVVCARFPNADDGTLSELPGVTITDLDLRGSKVTDEGLRFLRGIKGLRRIDLTATGITDKAARNLRAADPAEMVLDRTSITDNFLVAISGLQSVVELSVAGTRVSDRGVAALGKLRRLEVVSLSDTAVTDEGLKALTGLELRSLSIANTMVTDRSVPHLKALRCLIILDARGTQLSRAGDLELRRANPGLRIDGAGL